MDPVTFGLTAVGSIVGAGTASFAAVYKLLVLPSRQKVAEAGVDREELEALRKEFGEFKASAERRRGNAEREAAVLAQRVKALEERLHELKEGYERLQHRMSTFVTDEEWQAGQNQMQQSVTALTEKVGRSVGAIEAWQSRGAR